MTMADTEQDDELRPLSAGGLQWLTGGSYRQIDPATITTLLHAITESAPHLLPTLGHAREECQ
jgi:hypothetical protein